MLLAAGLIAGEALVGILFALLSFLEVNYTLVKEPTMFWISILILAGIAVYLVKVPLANAGEADEPAPPSASF